MTSDRLPWWALRRRRHCPHESVEGIYGDEINYTGGYRLLCRRCRTWLDGPVRIAVERPVEKRLSL